MTLIIQIALGILLGYLLIEHRQRLGRWALLALKALLVITFVAIVFTGLSQLPEAVGLTSPEVSERLSRIGETLTLLLEALPMFFILWLGAYGFFALVRKLVSRWFRLHADPLPFMLLGFLNVLLIWPLDLFLQWNTPYGDLYRSIDSWSRQNGYADALGGLLSFSLTLWPWIVILVAGRFGVEFFPKDIPPSLRRTSEDVGE